MAKQVFRCADCGTEWTSAPPHDLDRPDRRCLACGGVLLTSSEPADRGGAPPEAEDADD